MDEQPAGRPDRLRDGPGDEPQLASARDTGEAGPPGSAGLAPGLPGRSPNLATCPFFRSAAPDGTLGPPLEAPDPINRCAAFGAPKPQSYRQQELVCLTSGHVGCPRYLQGAAVARPGSRRIRRIRPNRPLAAPVVGRATGAATVLLAAAVVASVGFVFAHGGLSLPRSTPTPAVAAATQSQVASPSVEPSPTAAPTASPSPSAVASASPRQSPSASPTLPPTPSKTPRSDRYDLLEPCTDQPRCWIYTIRSGDNLSSIANYFGIPLETVRDLNPWTRTQGLRAGQELILPPPTR